MGRDSVNDPNAEIAEMVVKEEVVLEKFDGTDTTVAPVERVYIVDGVITKHEFLEDGEVVRTVEKEGGEDNTTN